MIDFDFKDPKTIIIIVLGVVIIYLLYNSRPRLEPFTLQGKPNTPRWCYIMAQILTNSSGSTITIADRFTGEQTNVVVDDNLLSELWQVSGIVDRCGR